MAKRKPSRFDPYSRQAQTQGQLRYGGQERALEALLGSLVDDLSTTTRSQTGAARGIENAVAAERPQLQGAIGRAQATPGLSAQGSARLAETLANAEAELGQRSVGAREGAKYAIDRAVSDYRKESGKLKTEMAAVAAEKGLFMEDLFGQLVEADRGARREARSERAKLEFQSGENALDRAQQQVNALIGQGIDPSTGGLLPGQEDESSRGGRKPASRDKHLEYKSDIESMVQLARKWKGKLSRQKIVEKLSTGRSGQTIKVDPDTGEELPNPVNVPGFKPYKPDLRMSAALDIALDGTLGKTTQRRLHEAGFSVRDLGVPSYGQRPRSRSGLGRRPSNAPGPGGQLRPT